MLGREGCPADSVSLSPELPAAAAGAVGASDYDTHPTLDTDYIDDLSSNSVTNNDIDVSSNSVTNDGSDVVSNSVTTNEPLSGTFDNVSCTLLKCGFKLTGQWSST